MQVGEHFGVFEVLFIVLKEHFACILVQRALREWYDQQTFYHFKDVVEGPGCRVPVFFERVDTYLPFFGDVGMENFRDEVAWNEGLVTFGGIVGEVLLDC